MLRTLTAAAFVAATALAATPAHAATDTVAGDQTYVAHNVLSGAPNDVFRTSFTFEEGNQVAGNYGCNSFTADYAIDGGTITFDNYAVTERHCFAWDSNESYYPDFFSGTHRFAQYAGHFVTITQDDGDKLYAFAE